MNIGDILGGEKFFASIIDEIAGSEEPAVEQMDDLFDTDEFDKEFSDDGDVFDTMSADGGEYDDDDNDEIFDGGAAKDIGDVSEIIGDILDNYYTRLV